MNKNFRIAITPLSPIHIGCGDVFEPTGYVVDVEKRRMYCFNPSAVLLQSKTRDDLLNAANSGSYKTIRSFFHEHMTEFRPFADAIIPMDAATARAYGKMLHPQGNQKATKLEIFRAAYEATPETIKAYIPGSSLKGTIKTALVDRLNAGKIIEAKKIDGQVLKGKFANSPLRFLKVSDLHSDKPCVLTKSRNGRRFFKDSPYADCGVQSAFFETVEPGQFRCFTGDITLVDSSMCGNYPLAYKTSRDLMCDVNSYSKKIWDREVGLYRAADSAWAESVENLLRNLQSQIKAGKVALVRLGKNGGAESKTLKGKNVAQIKIRHRKKRPEILDYTTTLWFAPEKTVEKNGKAVASGLPFGWALLEVLEENQTSGAIRNWCATVSKKNNPSEVALLTEKKAIRTERSQRVKELNAGNF